MIKKATARLMTRTDLAIGKNQWIGVPSIEIYKHIATAWTKRHKTPLRSPRAKRAKGSSPLFD